METSLDATKPQHISARLSHEALRRGVTIPLDSQLRQKIAMVVRTLEELPIEEGELETAYLQMSPSKPIRLSASNFGWVRKGLEQYVPSDEDEPGYAVVRRALRAAKYSLVILRLTLGGKHLESLVLEIYTANINISPEKPPKLQPRFWDPILEHIVPDGQVYSSEKNITVNFELKVFVSEFMKIFAADGLEAWSQIQLSRNEAEAQTLEYLTDAGVLLRYLTDLQLEHRVNAQHPYVLQCSSYASDPFSESTEHFTDFSALTPAGVFIRRLRFTSEDFETTKRLFRETQKSLEKNQKFSLHLQSEKGALEELSRLLTKKLPSWFTKNNASTDQNGVREQPREQ